MAIGPAISRAPEPLEPCNANSLNDERFGFDSATGSANFGFDFAPSKGRRTTHSAPDSYNGVSSSETFPAIVSRLLAEMGAPAEAELLESK